MLDSEAGEFVSGYSLPHWRRWLDVAGALVAMVLVFVAAPSRAESQEPSSPPCSNVPTLKKSGQPTLPPCPEPEDESTPAESGSRPSLPATAPLLDRAREAAFEFSRKLPNFICQEQMEWEQACFLGRKTGYRRFDRCYSTELWLRFQGIRQQRAGIADTDTGLWRYD